MEALKYKTKINIKEEAGDKSIGDEG